MKKVVINPKCFENHRAPHIPWYINRECTALNPGVDGLAFAVTELDEKTYQVEGIWFGESYFEGRGRRWIYRKDCEEVTDQVDIQARCKNCKHWGQTTLYAWPDEDTLAEIGTCRKSKYIQYYNTEEDALEKMGLDEVAGDNIYTGANFGCIHFEE